MAQTKGHAVSSTASKDSLIFRRVFRNAASNYADIAVTLAANFFLTPFLLHRLGAVDFGLWILVASLMNYGRLFDFGINGAVTKYIAEHQVTGEMGRTRRLVSTSFAIYSILGLGVIALITLCAPLLTEFFKVPANQQADATRFFWLMGVWVGLSLPCTTPMSVLRGLQRFDAVNIIDISVGTILPTIASVVVILQGGGLVGLVLVRIVSLLATQVPSLWLIQRISPEIGIGWHGVDRESARMVLGFGSTIFIGQGAKRLQTKTDAIVISAVLSVSAVTPFAVALRLSELGRTLVDQFVNVLLPLASELHAEGDWRRLRSLYITSTRLVLAISVPIAGAFIALGGPFLALWVGRAYARYGYLVTILMIAAVVSLSQWPAASVFQGMNRYRLLALSSLTSGLVNLGLSIFLARHMGLTGVALGTLIPTVIETVAFVMPYTMHVLEVSVSEAVKKIFLPTFVPAMPMLVALYAAVHMLRPRSLFEIGFVAALGIGVYGAGYLAVGASTVERRAYRSVALQTARLAEARLRRS